MIVCDTNVVLDALIPIRPRYTEVQRFIEVCVDFDIELIVPAFELATCFYVVRRELSSHFVRRGTDRENSGRQAGEMAWNMLRECDLTFTIVATDPADIGTARAFRQYHNDFEDNLVVAAAHRLGVRYLASYDAKLVAHAPVPCASPRELVRLIEGGMYGK